MSLPSTFRTTLFVFATLGCAQSVLAQTPVPIPLPGPGEQQASKPPLPLPEGVRGGVDPRVVAPKVADAASKGNVALLDGRSADARKAYTDAQVLAPEVPELEYNLGVVSLLGDDLEAAKSSFNMTRTLAAALEKEEGSAEAGTPSKLAADSQFNLAHVSLREDDLPAAIQGFAAALANDPEAADARRNLELALRMAAAAEQQQQEQQDGEDGEDGEEEEQEQDQEQQEGEQEQDSEQDEQQQGEQDQQQQGEDEQEQEQESQPGEEEQQQEQQPQERPGQMSREKAEELLDALAEEERQALEEMRAKEKKKALPAPGGKDW